MKTIKLKEIEGKGRVKYIHRDENYPIELGEIIRFKWGKPWKTISIFTTQSLKGETK